MHVFTVLQLGFVFVINGVHVLLILLVKLFFCSIFLHLFFLFLVVFHFLVIFLPFSHFHFLELMVEHLDPVIKVQQQTQVYLLISCWVGLLQVAEFEFILILGGLLNFIIPHFWLKLFELTKLVQLNSE